MTESQFTQRLLRALRQALPDAVVIKHINPMTAGVPDFSVTRYDSDNHTTWCEVKLIGRPHTGSAKQGVFMPLQFEMAKRLNAWYCVWNATTKNGYLFLAREAASWTDGPELTFAELVERMRRMF
jgi:hypothetical protein